MRRQREAAPPRYRITLTCGHDIRTLERPWNASSRYACRQGTGCGYRLAWVEWSDGATSGTNPGPDVVVDPPPGLP